MLRAAPRLVLLLGLAGCGAAEVPRTPPVVGPAEGPLDTWVELPWLGADPSLPFNGAKLHASGDSAYLLVADRFYRSDDHGAHWSQRGQEPFDDFAVQGPRLFGWTTNQSAPLYTSVDDGLTWRGRPIESYSGDHIQSTGALASPALLRVLGPHALMTQPSDEARLLVTDDPTRGWTPTVFAGNARVRDVAMHGSDLYACTTGGLFRSTDGGRAWTPLPSPDGNPAPLEVCTFTRFTTLLCLTVWRSWAQRLYCSADAETWTKADEGLFEIPKNPDWERFMGLAHLEGTAQLGSTYVLADRGDNSHTPVDEGVYTTRDPFAGWTRVEALRGQRILDVTQTTQAILVLSQTKTERNDSPVRLFRLRVR